MNVAVEYDKTRRPGRPDIVEKTLGFSVLAISLSREVAHNDVGRIVARQFQRAATSIGANVHEAQAGQSRADFIAKISIAYKEARETAYWLTLIERAGLGATGMHSQPQEECSQICRILASILMTSKGLAAPAAQREPHNSS